MPTRKIWKDADPARGGDGLSVDIGIDSDDHLLYYYDVGDSAARTVVNEEEAQTITGAKTFSGGATISGASTVSGVATFSAEPVFSLDGNTAGGVRAVTVKFDVTDGHDAAVGTSTGTVEIPAGATILDIQVQTTVLWNAGTSTTMIVGDDDDPDGWFTGVNLQATDLLVGEVLTAFGTGGDTTAWGGKNGAYLTAAGRRGRTTAGVDSGNYLGAATEVIGSVTTVGTVPTTGTTYMTVFYVVPTQTAASYAAT